METNGTAAMKNAVGEPDSFKPTDIEQGISAPGGASALSDSWYLQAYAPRPSVESNKDATGRERLLMNGTWRKFAVALSLGLCAGFGVAALKVAHSPAAIEQTKARRLPLPAAFATQENSAKPFTGRSQSMGARETAQETIGTQSTEKPATEAQTKTAPARLSKASASLTLDEAARLKARNRRLEALIDVLRQRTQEKKPAPEQTTYIGQ